MITNNGAYRSLAPQAFAETSPQFYQSYFVPRLGIPLETAFASYGQLYRTQVWIAAAVNKVADSIARLPLHVWDESPETGKNIDLKGPYAQLMENPCVTMPLFSFKQWIGSTIEIYGEAYLLKIRAGRGDQITSLLPMHPSMTMIYRNEYGETEYRFLGRPNERFPERDVVPFRRYNPDNTMRGLSRLEALRSTLMSEDSSRRAMQAWWQNRARPSMILRSKRELGESGRQRVQSAFTAQHGGSGNTGRVVVLENDEFEDPMIVQNTAEEMQYLQSRQLAREEVAAGMDLPPTALQDMTRATFCLPSDALISTRTGPKPIVDVHTGDEVWSYDGEKLKLSEVTWAGQTGELPVYTVRTGNRTLRATGNHPVLVAQWSVLYPDKKTHQYGPPEFMWKRVDQLQIGDLLIAAHGYATQTKRTYAPNGREITTELMEFCGLLMGDGGVSDSGVSIAHASNARYIDHYKTCAEILFNRQLHGWSRPACSNNLIGVRNVQRVESGRYRAVVRGRYLGTWDTLEEAEAAAIVSRAELSVDDLQPIKWQQEQRSSRFSSVLAGRELKDLGFSGDAHTKSIPGWLFECSEDMRLAFLRGIIDADGSVDKQGRISFTLCNKRMTSQVRDMMIGLGIPVTNLRTVMADVTLPSGKRFKSTSYQFTASDPGSNQRIGSHDSVDMQRIINGKPFDMAMYKYATRSGQTITPPIGAQLSRVVSISSTDETAPVYDLTVPDGHSFIADGLVVHNSNVVENMRSLYRDSMTPRVEFIESVLRTHVGNEFNGPKTAKFDMRHVLRGDWESRAAAHAQMIQSGFEKPAEARVDMDLPDAGPVADALYAQQQIQPLGAPPAHGGTSPTPVRSPAALPSGGTSSTAPPSQQSSLTGANVSKYVRDISGLIGRGRTLHAAADELVLKTGDRDGVRAAFEYLLGRQL